ncbi:MAG TPA: alcohol dehydrogenase [Flexistipes sinusarabici]|uniref:Alcohol dehydrogenase n=1 Tax=Flexistipes sinusarabici TaxID=2352 RepID=A0A3D5QBK2_FLESI|nr:alcohol dehydrogenase [Flexistipes sinusarabici]
MKFDYHNPTDMIFGAGSIERRGEVTGKYGKKALIVTGGGSVKKSGVFDKAVASLTEEGIDYAECTGVEPNPRISTVKRGADIAAEKNCDVIIALGGGSVMDASKVMSAAYYYAGDPWDMIWHGQEDVYMPTKALPVITVPTLAATGSEMNMGAVISNDETKIKSFIQSEQIFPRMAVVDPELTLSVPADQTAYGVYDIITHLTETYFNGSGGTPIQDRFAESVIIETMKYGKRAVENGNDLEARTQVQWASILALNGWLQLGTNFIAPVHMIEHALSAHHDITHAAGLAIVNPAWMRFSAKSNPEKFAQFGERVFGLKREAGKDLETAFEAIDKLEDFHKSIGCPARLSEVGIGDEKLEQYAKDAMLVVTDGKGHLLGNPPMSVDDIVGALRSVL